MKNIDPTGMWSVDCSVSFGMGTVDGLGARVLGRGNDDVRVLQKALLYLNRVRNDNRYGIGAADADGGYGGMTRTAVHNYKYDKNEQEVGRSYADWLKPTT